VNPLNFMGCKKWSETLERPHGYSSVPDHSFRSMILHAFFANSSRIQVFLILLEFRPDISFFSRILHRFFSAPATPAHAFVRAGGIPVG
jgi:hypothetical protein